MIRAPYGLVVVRPNGVFPRVVRSIEASRMVRVGLGWGCAIWRKKAQVSTQTVARLEKGEELKPMGRPAIKGPAMPLCNSLGFPIAGPAAPGGHRKWAM